MKYECEYMIKLEAFNKLYIFDFLDNLDEAKINAEKIFFNFCYNKNYNYIEIIPINGNVKYISEPNSKFDLSNGIVSISVIEIYRNSFELDTYIMERINQSHLFSFEDIMNLSSYLNNEDLELHYFISN